MTAPETLATGKTAEILYPDCDGKRTSDNTVQFRWITVLAGNLMALFRLARDVFVAGDLLWYPVEGENEIRQAPDVMVVFGRPRGDRGSYRQWVENDVPVTVAFEILSPNNTDKEMIDKFLFYDHHGVEEYYVYDPDKKDLKVWLRGRATLVPVNHDGTFTSPRLKIRFDLTGDDMIVYYPDGQRFLTFEELQAAYQQTSQQLTQTETRLVQTEKRLTDTRQQSRQRRVRAARMAELNRKARSNQATVEEIAELERLEQEALDDSNGGPES